MLELKDCLFCFAKGTNLAHRMKHFLHLLHLWKEPREHICNGEALSAKKPEPSAQGGAPQGCVPSPLLLSHLQW